MGRKEPYKTLLSLGWRMSKIEPALLLFGLDGKLSGLIITHVDDLYCAGEGQVYEASIIPCLQKHSGCRADGFTLTGIEDGDYLRSLLIELKYPGKKILGLDLQFQKAMMACFTGANKELGKHPQQGRGTADKRVGIRVSQVK